MFEPYYFVKHDPVRNEQMRFSSPNFKTKDKALAYIEERKNAIECKYWQLSIITFKSEYDCGTVEILEKSW